MKHLKTYESFADDRNVVKRFTTQEIVYMIQEITDDLDICINPASVRAVELDCQPSDDNIDPEIIDMNGQTHLLSFKSNRPNCYIVELDVRDDQITKSRKPIEKIMNDKSSLYNINYLLSDILMMEGGAIMHHEWQILIY